MKRLKKAVYSACFIAGAVQLTACTQKLYGPPPTSAAVSPTEEVSSTEEVTPTEEVPEVVYGPPEMLESISVEVTTPSGKTEYIVMTMKHMPDISIVLQHCMMVRIFMSFCQQMIQTL